MSSTEFIKKPRLPSHDELFSAAEKASDILENESSSYRPTASNGQGGALIDFSISEKPVIIIPDLHGRHYFLKNVLDYKIRAETEFLDFHKNISVLEALEKDLVTLVFLGDAMHTEKTTVERWEDAMFEFENSDYTGQAMSEEMTDNLTLLLGLLKLKYTFPENFHFLKGNHENITNKNSLGDFSFRKYADEGRMVNFFMADYYGDDVIYMISCVEDALPLVFANPNCVISHAEPERRFSRNEIINGRLYEDVTTGLTWTDNDTAQSDSAVKIIRELLPQAWWENASYFGGHRPVKGTYRALQNGRYFQLHNPLLQNVVMLRPDKIFNPNTDIINVESKKKR